ncbi:MAG: trimeric intracellular cation channel family protein [Prevotella sp.]|uniref:trimeric intracellular cation channel family protein n=1 Tax=Prevotella sp. TaxID=59823 RepID=UPI002A26BE76|nr:trimeric intracellular cation channel family protein [Prevotella sp.]MDD7318156.1 trimeric intracellular cation channel family protein [Prevotellaceae bacterium]MDY4020955.1 trimeric intracellular cation channel family protein [Prevotella sp.]
METFIQIIEFLGTFAAAISGVRLAAAKEFDWFGGYVVGLATAIGGGTLRDVMIDATPFWMTKSIYIICTGIALVVVLIFKKYLVRLNNTWFIFDTLGLAFFTVAGIQKSMMFGFPFWVSITMGCITGAAGGVVRDVLINEVPLIFRKEIYALASIVGGVLFYLLLMAGVGDAICAIICFVSVVLVRVLAVKYHISLPHLKAEDLER